MPITNYEFEQLKNRIQYAMLEVMRLQRQYNDLTGRDFVISGPRSKPESRDCIYINYTPVEGQLPHTPEYGPDIEFEGHGVGGMAVAEYFNNVAMNYDEYFWEHVIEAYEKAMSKEAEADAADRADWEYEQHKDRRMCRPIHEADWGFDD